MIDEQTVREYWRQGWVVVENVFERDEVQRIAELAREVSEAELSEAREGYGVDRGDSGEAMPRKIDAPFTKHGRFRRFMLDERLREVTSRLLGDQALPARDQIFMKPPRFGSAKPWHQDNYYFQCDPADGVITAWIALDDVDQENGCLRYIDGSHQEGILPHEPLPGEPHNLLPKQELIDLSRESLAPVGAGGVVFHHGQTLHTSHRNESDRWRRAYATHWLTPQVTTTNKGLWENAYFRDPNHPEAAPASARS